MKLLAARVVGGVVLLLLAGISLASCGGRIYQVVGDDMEPNFQAGQVITSIPVPTKIFTRGETVVYQLDNGDIHFKRVVGVPGDVILIIDGGVLVLRDGILVGSAPSDGPQLTDGLSAENENRTILGDDEYFIVGDNLRASFDSRHHGPIPADHILGRAEVTLLTRLIEW